MNMLYYGCTTAGFAYKHWRKSIRQSIMDNAGTVVTLGTQDTGRRQTHKKVKTQHRKL